MQRISRRGREPEPLVEAGSAIVPRVYEHPASADKIRGLESPNSAIGDQRPAISLALQGPVDGQSSSS